MGHLVYDRESRVIEIEDRTLAHLQVVILNKLRRQESFPFSWSGAGGSVSFWMHPSVALQFVYSGGRQPALNRLWLEILADSANSTAGLVAIPEPPDQPLG